MTNLWLLAVLLATPVAQVSAIALRHTASTLSAPNATPSKPPLNFTFVATITSGDHGNFAARRHVVADERLLSVSIVEDDKDGFVVNALQNRRYMRQRFFDEVVCYAYEMNANVEANVLNRTAEERREDAEDSFIDAVGTAFGVPLDLYTVADRYDGDQSLHGRNCSAWSGYVTFHTVLMDAPSDELMQELNSKMSSTSLQAALDIVSHKRNSSGNTSFSVDLTYTRNFEFCVNAAGRLLHATLNSKYDTQPRNRSRKGKTVQFSHAASAIYQQQVPKPEELDGAYGAASGRCVDLTSGRVGASELKSTLNDAGRVARINDEADGYWKATQYDMWQDATVEEIVPTFGTKIGPLSLPLQQSGPHRNSGAFGAAEQPLPDAFDPRQNWPMCQSIGSIRNQGNCGSCWAFSAVAVLEDRLCIAAAESSKAATLLEKQHGEHGKIASLGPLSHLELSPGHLVSCDDSNFGCDGGRLDDAWWYLRDFGVPLESCRPYQYCPVPTERHCQNNTNQTSNRSVDAEASLAPGVSLSEPSSENKVCEGVCQHGKSMHLFRASSAYAVSAPGDIKGLQRDLLARGPVQVAFFVFSDFTSYAEGIYFRTPSAYGPLGGHAVRLLGWGQQKTNSSMMDYWLIANSWSAQWGEGGNFRIRRGTNECGIEATPASGLAPQDSAIAAFVSAQESL